MKVLMLSAYINNSLSRHKKLPKIKEFLDWFAGKERPKKSLEDLADHLRRIGSLNKGR